MKNEIPEKVKIHPVSFKLIKKGHPWITADSFTEKFPKKNLILEGTSSGISAGFFLNDPQHKKVKARFWGTKIKPSFRDDLKERIFHAFELRLQKGIEKERDNFYLIFGEADFLPGLFVQKLGSEILIQFYALFWLKIEKELIEIIKESLEKIFLKNFSNSHLWLQLRSETNKDQSPPRCLDTKIKDKEIIIHEFGIKYKIYLGTSYDIGIYTDMSATRKMLKNSLLKNGVGLNLYSYSGAFSLYLLKNGFKEVTSIDLSKQYLDWLDENLKLNELSHHRSLNENVISGLKRLRKEERKFDFIICDPPSSSSDGKKKSFALTQYEEVFPLLHDLINKKGMLLVFLNTHFVTRAKFKAKIETLLQNQYSIIYEYTLKEDCPRLKFFQEGDYLKGLLLQKK